MNRAVFMQSKGHEHAEAFCLMKYSSDDGMIVEWLWNSRDGVTPFIIRSRDGSVELVHREMQYDRYLPDYQPLAGERIFVDLTPERAQLFAQRRVEQYWDHPDFPMSEMFSTREMAIEVIYKDMFRPDAPDIIEAKDWKR